MEKNKPKALAFILSACFLYITTCSLAQKSLSTAAAKGYYSIYNNGEKLNRVAARTNSIRKNEDSSTLKSNILATKPKGYYSIESNIEKIKYPFTSDRFYFYIETNSKVIQNMIPGINKGYYSIGNNGQKLQK
ncbi:hypothetical protein [Segetibacter koreensis]|uniref:hypothetical protein n=1 Tax=Segetibacter koreensis TaxID=398037 RepID=UPI00037E47EA|nr:hypothetical protein [Segetibacter koreensis]